MARHRSPRVEKHWDLLVQMHWLIQSGVTPRGAAVSIAKEHWRDVSKSYDACVWWLQDNFRKFRDELDPSFAFWEEIRVWREEWLSKLSPQERKRAEQVHESNLRHLRGMADNRRRYYEDHPEELKKKVEADFKRLCRAEIEAMIRNDPEVILAKLMRDD
jgi:hypothetical protein